MLELPQQGDSNKYPQHMFLGVLNTVFLNISNYLPHLELWNRSIQTVVVTNFVIISNVGIKRFDCINNDDFSYLYYRFMLRFFLAADLFLTAKS